MMWDSNSGNKHIMSDVDEDDDSWEVRAFEEDTAGNLMGCTWPPRSYTCTFCRREFRSAQALGGHMNVHRRDRARLHHGTQRLVSPASPEAPPSVFLPAAGQDFVAANGLCLLYPNGSILIPPPATDFPSALLPIPPVNNLTVTGGQGGSTSLLRHDTNSSDQVPLSNNYSYASEKIEGSSAMEEVDLELRLGRRSP